MRAACRCSSWPVADLDDARLDERQRTAGAPFWNVSVLRERFAETDDGADVGGAPKGCVRSLWVFTAAIAASAAARRRRSCSSTRRASARDRTAVAHRAVSRGETCESPAGSLTHAPAAGASTSDGEFVRRSLRRSHQDDLRAPPAPTVVPLGLVHDQAGGLQVVEPALDAAPVRSDEARSVGTAARDGPPSHDRREPDDELSDRRRVARGPFA